MAQATYKISIDAQIKDNFAQLLSDYQSVIKKIASDSTLSDAVKSKFGTFKSDAFGFQDMINKLDGKELSQGQYTEAVNQISLSFSNILREYDDLKKEFAQSNSSFINVDNLKQLQSCVDAICQSISKCIDYFKQLNVISGSATGVAPVENYQQFGNLLNNPQQMANVNALQLPININISDDQIAKMQSVLDSHPLKVTVGDVVIDSKVPDKILDNISFAQELANANPVSIVNGSATTVRGKLSQKALDNYSASLKNLSEAATLAFSNVDKVVANTNAQITSGISQMSKSLNELAGADKNLQDILNYVNSSTDEYTESTKAATQASDDNAKANKRVIESLAERSKISYTKFEHSTDRQLGSVLEYDKRTINDDASRQIDELYGKMQDAQSSVQNLYNSFAAALKETKPDVNKLRDAFTALTIAESDAKSEIGAYAAEAKKLSNKDVQFQSLQTTNVANVEAQIKSINDLVESSSDGKIAKFKADCNEITESINQLGKTLLSKRNDPSVSIEQWTTDYKEFETKFSTAYSNIKKIIKDTSYNIENLAPVSSNGSVIAQNIKTADEYKQAVQQYITQYKTFDGRFNASNTQWTGSYRDANNAVQTLTVSFDRANGVVRAYSADAKGAASATQQIGEMARYAANRVLQSIAAYVSIYRVIGMIKQGIQYVVNLDTALAQLQIVTGKSSSTLKEAEDRARSIGDAIGSTTTEVLNSATDWARLGYSMSDALTLAQKSAELAKTGFMDVATATEQMTSAIQAFYGAKISNGLVSVDEAASHINDELVQIGNNMPITSQGLGDALERSAGSLVAAGNTLEQSVALISAANSTIQNPESVGNALKTVSMRLRGTKVSDISNELGEDVSDDFKNAAQDASKLYAVIKQLTAVKANDFQGVSILTDTGAYKSTFEIIKEIANAWGQMTDINQAALLEQIAG